jgi:hypothetical protein
MSMKRDFNYNTSMYKVGPFHGLDLRRYGIRSFNPCDEIGNINSLIKNSRNERPKAQATLVDIQPSSEASWYEITYLIFTSLDNAKRYKSLLE